MAGETQWHNRYRSRNLVIAPVCNKQSNDGLKPRYVPLFNRDRPLLLEAANNHSTAMCCLKSLESAAVSLSPRVPLPPLPEAAAAKPATKISFLHNRLRFAKRCSLSEGKKYPAQSENLETWTYSAEFSADTSLFVQRVKLLEPRILQTGEGKIKQSENRLGQFFCLGLSKIHLHHISAKMS